jgi:hypothetical protein
MADPAVVQFGESYAAFNTPQCSRAPYKPLLKLGRLFPRILRLNGATGLLNTYPPSRTSLFTQIHLLDSRVSSLLGETNFPKRKFPTYFFLYVLFVCMFCLSHCKQGKAIPVTAVEAYRVVGC